MCGIRRGLNFDFLRKGGKVRLRGAPRQAPLARSWIPHVGEGFDFERKIFWARDRSDFSIMNSNLEQIQERQRVRARIVSLATVVCLTAAMFTVTAFAANTDTAQGFQQITTAGKSILKGLWDMLQAITAPLALVGIGFNVVKALIGTEKGMEKCKDNIVKILFVVGVIFLAPLFVTTLTGAIGNIADNSTNQIFG